MAVGPLGALLFAVIPVAVVISEQERVKHQAERIISDLEREAEGLRFQFGLQAFGFMDVG